MHFVEPVTVRWPWEFSFCFSSLSLSHCHLPFASEEILSGNPTLPLLTPWFFRFYFYQFLSLFLFPALVCFQFYFQLAHRKCYFPIMASEASELILWSNCSMVPTKGGGSILLCDKWQESHLFILLCLFIYLCTQIDERSCFGPPGKLNIFLRPGVVRFCSFLFPLPITEAVELKLPVLYLHI